MGTIWYAVQHGAYFGWDGEGSRNYGEALDIADEMIGNPEYDGEEIRIAVIDEDHGICSKEIILRDGARTETDAKRREIGTISTEIGAMTIWYNGAGREATGECGDTIEEIGCCPSTFSEAVDDVVAMYGTWGEWDLDLTDEARGIVD